MVCPVAARRSPDASGQRRRQLDGEHDLRPCDLHWPLVPSSFDIAARLTLREPVTPGQRHGRVGHLHATVEQLHGGVHPLGDLIRSSPATFRHDIYILLLVPFGVVDLPTPLLAPDVGQRDVELEVRDCVRGVLSPLLANIALSVLDEFIATGDGGPGSTQAERARRRRRELPNYRLVRYADDFLVLVSGNRGHAEDLCQQVAAVLAPMGLRLSAEKTWITHIDDGFDFLGWRIQRQTKKGTADRRYVYTYPAKKSLASITDKVKAICGSDTNLALAALLHQLNRVLRGWTTYFRPGVSFATFRYLRAFAWRHVVVWVRRKHRRITWRELRRRYCNGGWWPTDGKVVLFNPTAAGTTRYRYRGTAIPSPWTAA